LERATALINKLEKGEIFLPRYNNSWLANLEAEWLSWTGLEEETADQIDAAGYAARHAAGKATGSWGLPFTVAPTGRWGMGSYTSQMWW